MSRQAVRTTAGKVLRSDDLIADEKEVARFSGSTRNTADFLAFLKKRPA